MNIRNLILHEDEDLIGVNKPAGLLTIPDRYDLNLPSLSDMLQRKYGKVYTVHRLDKDTSGVLLFAKNEDAHRFYSLKFQNREVEKYYRALVVGRIWDEKGVIDTPMARQSGKGGRMSTAKKGMEAKTSYEVVESFGLYTFLKIRLYTGRTHQIRVHLKSIGHPVAMDALYGSAEPFYLSSIKRKYRLGKNKLEEKPLMSRQALHASALVLEDRNGSPLRLEAPLAKDFKAMLHQLEKNLGKS